MISMQPGESNRPNRVQNRKARRGDVQSPGRPDHLKLHCPGTVRRTVVLISTSAPRHHRACRNPQLLSIVASGMNRAGFGQVARGLHPVGSGMNRATARPNRNRPGLEMPGSGRRPPGLAVTKFGKEISECCKASVVSSLGSWSPSPVFLSSSALQNCLLAQDIPASAVRSFNPSYSMCPT